jgi:hypothetical protein
VNLNWNGLDQWQLWALGIGCSLVAAFVIALWRKFITNRNERASREAVQQTAAPVMTQNFQPTININVPAQDTGLRPTGEYRRESAEASPSWEVRYPGGVADVSVVRGAGRRHRFAIGEDFTFINRSPHQVSLNVTFLIVYGSTRLATDPCNLPLREWTELLAGFGIRSKPQLLFPLNLAPHSSVEGHIAFSIRPDGAGRGIGGDVPEKRQYLFEFEDLLTKKSTTVVATAVFASDKNNHQRCSRTDLARPGPNEEPLNVD